MNTQAAILVVKKEKEKLTNLIKDCWKYCDDEIKKDFKIIHNNTQISNKHTLPFVTNYNYIEQTSESFLKTWGEKLNLIGIDNIIKFEMNDTWDMGYIIYKKPIDENENIILEEELNKLSSIKKVLSKENIEKANQDKMIMRQRRIERLTIMGGELRKFDKPW